ncbi:MAG: ATP-binding cassette domain-containing protein [Ktedonobacterales bacterium]
MTHSTQPLSDGVVPRTLRASISVPAPLAVPARGNSVQIGRAASSTYMLSDPKVSRRHARLVGTAAGQFILEDLASTNGTFVNHTPLASARQLQPGDHVQIGPYQWLFDGTALAPAQVDQTQVDQTRGMRLDAVDLVRGARRGRKVLLDQVTLSILPGEFVTIAGSNGAGKSTLLGVLAGFRRAQNGTVLFDGKDRRQYADGLRGRIGYVPQADIVHRTLSVENALRYAGRLRLPSDLCPEEVRQRIERVLADVDLLDHRHTLIKDLSGGERKRVNVAVELLADPPVLFLDEPNDGLDPRHRDEMRELLRGLATQGRTIVLVSHFVEDIQACDRLVFLGGGGRLCYFGPPAAVLDFFHVPSLEKIYAQIEGRDEAERWRQTFQQSALYAQQVLTRLPSNTECHAGAAARPVHKDEPAPEPEPRRRQSPLGQLALLMRRYTRIIVQDRINLAVLLLQAPLIGLILALVSARDAFQSPNGPFDAQEVVLLLAFVAIWFGASNAVGEICKEDDIYRRERLAGLGIAPYLLSKVCILGALCALQTLILLLIVSTKAGMPPAGAGLFLPAGVELYLGMVLAAWAGMALGLCASAFASNRDKAVSALPLILVPQLLLAGVIFPLSKPVQPLADATVGRWAVQSLGTAADLNHLYYAYIRAPAPRSRPLSSLSGNGSDGAATSPQASHVYSPSDYDSHPSSEHYTASVTARASWSDAVSTRKDHWLRTSGMLLLLFAGLAAAAGIRLKLKDPA